MDFTVFNDDREEVIDRARQIGIERILNPGIDIASSRSAIELAERHKEIFASVGIHPNSALSWNTRSLEELEEMALHTKVVAIGEIGLDYYRDRAPRQLQLNVFQSQLELAARMVLPIVVHNRKASSDVYSILHQWCVDLQLMGNPLWKHPGVLHSFSDDDELAQKVIADNFMIGVTGPITFNNAQVVQKMASHTSSDHLLIETDAPFLTPHPFRGTRNEPAHVRLVAGKIAQLKGIDIALIEEKTSDNADRLFKWRESS